MVTRASKPAAARKSKARPVGNGLKTFSLHSRDESETPAMRALNATLAANPSFNFVGVDALKALDPETAARGFLEHALASEATPGFAAPKAGSTPSEFKTLGT